MTTEQSIALYEQDPPTTSPGHVPGEVGVWVFIFGDLVVFTYMFGVFLNYRSNEGEVFAASSEFLSQNLGIVYTLVLLVSSLFVVRALHWMRAGRGGRASALFLSALGSAWCSSRSRRSSGTTRSTRGARSITTTSSPSTSC